MRKLFLLALFYFPQAAFAADCFISEYTRIGRDEGGQTIQIPAEPALGIKKVTYTTSTASAVFTSGTEFITVICNAVAHYEVDAAPVATADMPYLPADTFRTFAITQPSMKIAFYDGTS